MANGYLSGVQCRLLACGPYATAIPEPHCLLPRYIQNSSTFLIPACPDCLGNGFLFSSSNQFVPQHTHTHPFNGPFSRTTRVGRYQKGKTNLDFTEARDNEWQWHQLGICKSAPRSRQITTPAPHHSIFYRPDALPAAKPTASKH